MYVNKKISTTKIAEQIGGSQSGVERLLKRHGFETPGRELRAKLSDSDAKKAVMLYEEGMTTVEIGEMFGVTDPIIAKYIRKQGGSIRRAVRRSNVKQHGYFHTIDTKEKAYFLGWILTDGSVVEHKNRPDRSNTISFELKLSDKYMVERFATELGASKENVGEDRGRLAYFRFASKEMADDLAQYGIVPRKSLISYMPIIDESLMPHLIRGIFDGNGTVTIGTKDGSIRFAMYGTEELCTQFRDYLSDTIGLRSPKVSKGTCWHVWYYKHDAKPFFDYIYKDSEDLRLKRKYDRFVSWFDQNGITY